MADKKEYVNALRTTLSGVSPQNEVKTESDGTDKYKSLETTSYKQMLSSKVQAAEARDQSLKYANDALKASGIAGQGMAESARTGIYNEWGRALKAADEVHNQNILDIETKRIEDADTNGQERWQSAMSMMQQASSLEDLDFVRDNFYEGFTDEQKKYFDFYYNTYSNDLTNKNTAPVTGAYDYSSKKAYAYDKDGGSVSTEGKFNDENSTMNSAIATGKIQKDTYIQLHNNNGQDLYLYFGNDGKLYYVSKESYGAATKKVNIVGTNSAVNQGGYIA